MNPGVEVVVSHWKRPDNIKLIREALVKQTVPIFTTLTYAGALNLDGDGFLPDLGNWDRTFYLPAMGGWERVAMAGAYDHKYTLFIDDDVLPCPNFVESLLKVATLLEDRFAVLGFHGRRFEFEQIQWIDTPQTTEMVRWLARVYLFKTVDLHWAIAERLRAGLEIEPEGRSSHQDAIMCIAIAKHTGQPCYACPSPAGMNWSALPEDNALSKVEGYEESLRRAVRKL